MSTLSELRNSITNENISYSELAELDSLAERAGIEVTDEMTADDTLAELEAIDIRTKREAIDEAITEWQLAHGMSYDTINQQDYSQIDEALNGVLDIE